MGDNASGRPTRIRDSMFADARIADLQKTRGFVESFYKTVYQGSEGEILMSIDAAIAALERYKAAEFALMRTSEFIAKARSLATTDMNRNDRAMASAPITLIQDLNDIDEELVERMSAKLP